jgi:hypothetical protein
VVNDLTNAGHACDSQADGAMVQLLDAGAAAGASSAVARPGPMRGVTQVQWSPDGSLLLAAERKSRRVVGWDVRQFGGRGEPRFACRHVASRPRRCPPAPSPPPSYFAPELIQSAPETPDPAGTAQGWRRAG